MELTALTDLRLPSSKAATQQRSINLAISHRGIAALEAIDAEVAHRFLEEAIPMRGRMIHTQSGELDSQLYDKDGQVSASVPRLLVRGDQRTEKRPFRAEY